jgi:maleamate amidohydrolase
MRATEGSSPERCRRSNGSHRTVRSAATSPEWKPQGGDIEVVKQYPSAFAGTSLAATLTGLGVDTVIITGFSTSGCIRATATDAMQSGFIPVVVADAVGDRLPAPHEANLFDIQAKIGEVVSTAAALELFA